MSNEMHCFKPAAYVPEVPAIPATRTPFNPSKLLRIIGECGDSWLHHLVLETFLGPELSGPFSDEVSYDNHAHFEHSYQQSWTSYQQR